MGHDNMYSREVSHQLNAETPVESLHCTQRGLLERSAP
jgi:hypothetical protein